MGRSTLHDELNELAWAAYREELAFLDQLSPAEQSATGSMKKWSAKDELNHANYWKRRTIEQLSYASRGVPPPEYPDQEECNRLNFKEYKDTTLAYIKRTCEQTLDALPKVLERFSEEELLSKEPRIGMEEVRSIVSHTISIFQTHPLWHVALAFIDHEKPELASALQDRAMQRVLDLTEDPSIRAMVYLERAEFHAMLGEKESALMLLKQGLDLYPEYKAALSGIPFYESIRDTPEFQALTA